MGVSWCRVALNFCPYPLLAQEQIQAHWYLSGTRVLEWWMQTDKEFGDVLGYKTSLRLRWDAGHPASKATTAVAATIKTTNARQWSLVSTMSKLQEILDNTVFILLRRRTCGHALQISISGPSQYTHRADVNMMTGDRGLKPCCLRPHCW